MTTNAYLYRMGQSYPGSITRAEVAKVEPAIIDADEAPEAFGIPVILSGGKIQPWKNNGTIYGFLVRPFPTQSAVASEGVGEATPNPVQIADVLRSGYIAVKNTAGTPAKGDPVYANNTTGAIQASASGATQITGAEFQGEADEDGFVEISYNI